MTALIKKCEEARAASILAYEKTRAVEDDFRKSAISYVEFMLSLRADKTSGDWAREELEATKKALAELTGREEKYIELYSAYFVRNIEDARFKPSESWDEWYALAYYDYDAREELVYIPVLWLKDEEKFKADMKAATEESRKRYLASVRKKRAAEKKRRDEADRKAYERLRAKYEKSK